MSRVALGGGRQTGVTLIELAITIAIAGILAALVVQFTAPVRSYIDSSRRAALADTADTALRRIARDVRLALPNSARVTTSAGVQFLEIMLVRTGGRYRYDPSGGAGTCAAAGDALSFSGTDTCFMTIGAVPNLSLVTTSDYVVVYNLQPGTPNADAYQFTGTGGNKSQISGTTAGSGGSAGQDTINFASNTFAYESPGNRFFIVEGPVSFVCDPSAGTLLRRSGYTISASQPTSFATGSSAVLATGVNACSFTYDASVTAQGAGLVTMMLQLKTTDSRGTQELVTLYHTVHVNNVP
jgi:MSHA biogenesis protein MshO